LACEYGHWQGKYSLIFTKKQSFDNQFPLFVNTLSPQSLESIPNTRDSSRESFRYVQLSYNESATDLIRNLSSLQFYSHLPAVVIIDDLSLIIDSTLMLSRSSIEYLDQACRILGHLFDAVESFGCTDVLISDSCESSEYLNLLRRFLRRHILFRFETRTPLALQQSFIDSAGGLSPSSPSSPSSVDLFLASETQSILIGRSTLVGEGLELRECSLR
jgi:hypothetical protein